MGVGVKLLVWEWGYTISHNLQNLMSIEFLQVVS